MATSCRAKALAAWGVSRDLFKDNDAREIEGGADYEAALASPGETRKRGLSVDVGKISKASKASTPRTPDKQVLAKIALAN